MNTRNLKLGYVAVTLLTGSTATAYIRDYELTDGMPRARTRVNGAFITATWNGTNWAEVAPTTPTCTDGELQQAWEALQSVPSYLEAQAQAFVAEPEPVPLSERGVLNGDRAWSLLK